MTENQHLRTPVGPIGWTVALVGYLYSMTPLAIPLVYPGRGLPVWAALLVALPGTLSLILLWWLPRGPVAAGVAQAALWTLSPAVLGSALVTQERVARTQPRRVTIGVGVLLALAKLAGLLVWADGAAPGALTFEATLSLGGLVVASLLGWLATSSRENELRRLEAEQARRDAEDARVNEARLAERERIAREMHDVVAHRISLVALHAGALAHRPDADPAEAAELARLIQSNAQASLDELRAMLATLRGADAPPEPPQPTLATLDTLLTDARAAGQQVAAEVTGDLAQVPDRVSRHAFRIIQEGVTNARKHAPGAPVALALTVGPRQVELRVTNPVADLAPRNTSGAGLGLVGIVERVEQLGGQVSHGVHGADFVLQARLPFTPTEGEA